MDIVILLPLIASFFIAYFALPRWIEKAKKFGLAGKDMNKYDKPKVAEAGGLIAIGSFIISILLYIAIKTFYFKSNENLVEIFSIIASILMLAFIGLVDGLLGWKIGLRRRFRMLLCVFAAIPLMVINAGHSDIALPLIGKINLGLLYPLIIIPAGILATSTTFNFLAGFNGLEASQGIIILTALSIVSYFTENGWLALIILCMVFSLIAFFIFNKFPASVFPGDVLTYPIGGMIAIAAILGNFERVAVFFFIPYIIEVILKTRGKLVKQSFGKPNKDGSLEMPYNKIYGLEHLAIFILKKFNKNNERNVVYLINLFQIIVIILGFIIFRGHIFLG